MHNYNTQPQKSQYKTGNQYILVLSKNSSVYSGDIYHVKADIFIQIDENGKIKTCKHYRDDLKKGFSNVDEFREYIKKLTPLDKAGVENSTLYTKSKNLADIVEALQNIFKVKIKGIKFESKTDRNTYICSVIEILKGKTNCKVPGEIWAILFKGSVELGKEYILLLNTDNEHSLSYTLSSKDSVILADDTQKVEQLLEMLN